MVQTGNIYYNINTLGIFWSKLGYLTSWAPIYRAALSFYATGIGDIASRFNLNVLYFSGYYVLTNGPNL